MPTPPRDRQLRLPPKRGCVLCGADATAHKAVLGERLRLVPRGESETEFMCADGCAVAEHEGLDRDGIAYRREVAQAAARAKIAIAVADLGAAGRIALAPASDADFWGTRCRMCGWNSEPLRGVGADRRCIDIFACVTREPYNPSPPPAPSELIGFALVSKPDDAI